MDRILSTTFMIEEYRKGIDLLKNPNIEVSNSRSDVTITALYDSIRIGLTSLQVYCSVRKSIFKSTTSPYETPPTIPRSHVLIMAQTTTRTSSGSSNPLKRKMSPPEHPKHRPTPIPPAFAQGRGNQNERELPPTYILATSPVKIGGDWGKERQLPLGLILLIVSFVSDIFLLGVLGWKGKGIKRKEKTEGKGSLVQGKSGYWAWLGD
jgi:hypothetical protein